MKFILSLTFILFLAASCNRISSPYNQGTMIVAGQKLNVEVVRTPQEQALGLGGRQALSDSEGMIFPYDRPGTPTFWMKDMLFPIDIVWIRQGQVVDITHNAAIEPPGRPELNYTLYKPSTEVDQVLELRAGWAARHNLSIGDKVNYQSSK